MNRQQGGMWVVLAAGLFGSILGGSAARAVEYTITDLGTLGGRRAYVYGINNAGQVVGASSTTDGYLHAFVWQNGVMSDLGVLGGNTSRAYRINELGEAVGYSSTGGTPDEAHAAVWRNGIPQDLNAGGGSSLVKANGINDSGQVVGTGQLSAFLWDNGQVANLPFSRAYAINNNSQIAGTVYTGEYDAYGTPYERAVLWSSGSIINLGVSQGFTSKPTDLNDRGQVVGFSLAVAEGGGIHERGFLWDNGILQEIPAPPEWSTEALGINSQGDIVGRWTADPLHFDAFLYADGVMTDLNTVLPTESTWTLYSADGINDAGQIVGMGSVPGDDYQHVYLLTPVPEPITGVLVCVSALLMGRRRCCR